MHNPNSPPAVGGNALRRDGTPGEPEPLAPLVRALVQTHGFHRLLCMVLPELLSLWAGKSRFRQVLSRPLSKHVVKAFAAAGKAAGEPESLTALLNRGDFVESLSERLPALMQSLTGAVSALTETLGRIPVDRRTALVRTVLRDLSLGDAGRILNSAALGLSEIHAQDPTLFSEAARDKFRELVRALDFGQLKETVDRAEQDVVAAVAMAGEELWQYPAKVVCLLSLLPSMANMGIQALTKAVAPANGLAPDLLADVIASLLREVQGPRVGELVNELAEGVRSVHTGSVLIGDPGCPRLPQEVEALVRDVLTTLDVPLLLKAAGLLDDLKRASGQALSSALAQEPEMAKAAFLRPFRSAGKRSRLWSHRVEAWESLFTDEERAAQVSQGMADVSGEDLAETVNRFCALLNRADTHTPLAGANVLTRFVASLDPVEVGETARRFAGDLLEHLQPMAPDIVPPLIRGAASLLAAAERGGGQDLSDALSALRTSLHGKEAVP